MMGDTKEEALEKWWAKWRAADFTWEGLAKDKPVQGWVVVDGVLREAESGRVYGQPIPDAPTPIAGRDATLQDYWRADPASGRLRDDEEMAGELVVATGQPTYHVAHLPLTYGDGAETGKSEWADDVLDSIVLSRLIVSSDTQWGLNAIVGTDRDAQFQGGIWLKAARRAECDEHIPLCIRYNLALIFRDCDFARARFSAVVKFENAAFGCDASFESAVFAGASFWNVEFSQGARFQNAVFSGNARFEHVTFSRYAFFARVVFSGNTRFEHAVFSGAADFEYAAFNGEVWFRGAEFNSSVSFTRARFQAAARFVSVEFLSQAFFSNAEFGGEARFENSVFSKLAHWDNALFGGDALFRNVAFDGEAAFKSSVFNGEANFATSVFSSQTHFDEALFKANIDFTSATFEKLASFERIVWSERASHLHGAFDQVLFRGNLSLLGAGFRSFAAFDGATLERGLQFDEVGEVAAKARFKMERRAAIAAADADRPRHLSENSNAKSADVASHVRAQRDVRLRELERGCRVLKLAFERAANKSREQLLYRFELQARRAQRGLPPGEALFSDLYALASDYGASMVRPFVSLGILLLAFAATFYGFADIRGLGSGNSIADAWQAFDFSLANVFKPLSALSSEAAVQGSLAERLLTQAGYGWTTGVRALAILQSILAIVLAFLFALAVRRRFQIS